MRIGKSIPLAEITLRRYERPYNMPRREMIKKLCLSVGLLQPGDSRDVIVDVLSVLLSNKKELNSKDIEKEVIRLRKKNKLPMIGIAGSNIRRQLKRLRDLYLVENNENIYRITENEKLITIFEERIENFYLKSIVGRVKEYFRAVK